MRFPQRSQPHVCLPCQRRTAKLSFTTHSVQHVISRRGFRVLVSSRQQYNNAQSAISLVSPPCRRLISNHPRLKEAAQEAVLISDTQQFQGKSVALWTSQTMSNRAQQTHPTKNKSPRVSARPLSTATTASIELSESQQETLKNIYDLRKKLSSGLPQIPGVRKNPHSLNSQTIETVLRAVPLESQSPAQMDLIKKIKLQYRDQPFTKVRKELDIAASYRDRSRRKVTDAVTIDVLRKLDVVQSPKQTEKRSVTSVPRSNASIRRQSLGSMVGSPSASKPQTTKVGSKAQPKPFPTATTKADTKTVAGHELELTPIEVEQPGTVPVLSFDLDRVLFNPGVYSLRDPRSRVYNFDPYLEKLMPVSEFHFEALNPYLTSSEDSTLIQIAKSQGKRYIGSSSSMTALLSHFHFLISHWRPLDLSIFSRNLQESYTNFTNITKSPAAIFLRYRDGVYAVDADKEFDEPNILMNLGKSMEKLLTLEKDDFEKWRRSNVDHNAEPGKDQPEAFHYSQQGRFLFRSQLDAYDPRLPGTGYFDLKTRAVAGIRMNLRAHETGIGYEIKERLGNWESYEREYYDMMRSVFLKYSLQARMGSMDGIFVAYHNITRMFGFQYISLEEMDLALHGQRDPCLGDQEFRFSVNFLEEIFNIATEKYPQRSLRVHFDAREISGFETSPHMNIFVEPMSEEDITAIQNSQKTSFEAFERKLLEKDAVSISEAEIAAAAGEVLLEESSAETEVSDGARPPVNSFPSNSAGPASSAADKDFLDSILDTPEVRAKPRRSGREVLAFKLTVRNKINNQLTDRPDGIGPSARWTINYQLEKRSNDDAVKLYTLCRNKRISALTTVINSRGDDNFSRTIRELASKGAEWRQKQDELDAQRPQVVLYGDGRGKD